MVVPQDDCSICSNHKNNRLREYVGKVKIVLVDSPKKLYRRKKWAAAFIVLSQMLIGANVIIILFYVLSFKSDLLINLHIFLCTIGFQLCVPAGILSLSCYNGSTTPMSSKDRKFEHILLETFGLLCCLLGTIFIIFAVNIVTQLSLHAILGIVADCFLFISALTGLCTKNKNVFARCMKYVHVITGALAFCTSSSCFITGLLRPSIENWIPIPSIVCFLILFCFLYTTVITLVSFKCG